ncbi:MAG: phenylalanine--tRNA ligase subunit beta [Bacillota bacterium]
MLVPVKWLKEYVNINIDTAELADKLVSCGFEIEGVIDLSENTKNVVVGSILSTEKHPNADKLQICSIDVGTEKLQIVTGATNIAVGDKVPVAKDGAILPNGMSIKSGELRGVMSCGMLCSGGELNLTEADYKGAGIHGILILDPALEIGTDINIILGTDDIVLDVGITANRMEANSIYGIAREVAAVTGEELKPLNLTYSTIKEDVNSYVAVENNASDLCPRYMAAVAKNIVLCESPEIIKHRLRAVGLRPINNIVDITNYILFEIGQPMHAFDIETIEGGAINVRRANVDEKILALDGKEYTLNSDNLAICNAKEPMAVAGVMGGMNYSISDTTSTIVFESARFARDSVRNTARKLNLHSDSSARYEKGVDFFAQNAGLKRALAIISEYNWGTIVDGVVDSFPNPPAPKTVDFTAKDIESILGISISENRILSILNSLSLISTIDNGVITTSIPDYREDMNGINDIAEEVIRMYGYDNIVPTLIKDGTMVVGGRTPSQLMLDKIKDSLVGKGACEIITYSFITPKAFDYLCVPEDSYLRKVVKLANALGEDYSVMRTTLVHSMLKTLATNYLRGNKAVRLFEVAKTYIPKSLPLTTELPIENNVLCLGAYGEDFYEFKAIIEDLMDILRIDVTYTRTEKPYMHPTRTAAVIDRESGKEIGYFGEVSDIVAEKYDIDKRAYVAEIDAEFIIDNAKLMLPFKVISKYQAVERDLALIAAIDTEASAIIDTIKDAASEIMTDVAIFDIYTGDQVKEGFKSVAVKITFQSATRTLKDADVNAEISYILDALKGIEVSLR